MLLHLLTWPDVEAALQHSRAILIPIGSTEQHGPTGVIGIDALCAEAIARAVGERTNALVGPTIAVGMALHHMAFPGTISLRPTTLIAVLRDYVLSLAAHGFQRFYFVNGHGGNVPSLQAAFSDIHAEAQAGSAPLTNPVTDLQCTWVDWWKQPAVVKRQKEFFGEEDGIHATAGEISLSQYLYPEAAAKARPLEPVLAPTGPIHGAKDFRRRFPDGRIASNPSLASPERGEILFGIAVEAISAAFLEFARA